MEYDSSDLIRRQVFDSGNVPKFPSLTFLQYLSDTASLPPILDTFGGNLNIKLKRE
jgi:hypothetical protein